MRQHLKINQLIFASPSVIKALQERSFKKLFLRKLQGTQQCSTNFASWFLVIDNLSLKTFVPLLEGFDPNARL